MSRLLVLASGSPRRKELLAAAGYRFTIVVPRVSEISGVQLTIREVVLSNAIRKGRAVLREQPGAIVLAADTLVALDGETIGKPADLEAAVKTLRRLSGRTHLVCTAVFIGRAGRWRSVCAMSQVRFRRLSGAQIRRYVAKINPLDKAGAYAAQEPGGEIIARIEGSFSNVVGLPMEETGRLLREFGVEPEIA